MLIKNGATPTVVFIMVDSADHLAAKTGLGAGVTVNITKNGGTFAATTNAAAEIANGFYKVALTATETNTNGPIGFHCTATGADPSQFIHEVVAFDPTDSVRLGLTAMPNAAAGASGGLPLSADASGRVDVLKINGTSQTARDIGASVLLSSGTGTGQLSLSSGLVTLAAVTHTGAVIPTVTNLTNAPTAGDLTSTMKTSVEAAVWDAARASHTTAATFGQGAASVQGNVTGSVGSVTGAVGSVTGAVGSVTGAVGSVTGAVGSVTGNVGGNVVGSVASVTAAVSVTGDLSATMKTSVTAAVWDVTMSGHTTAGTTGATLSGAGSAGDPWTIALPGSYGAGSAGYLVGTYVNASISAVKTQTDKLAFTTTNQVDCRVFTNSDKTGYSISGTKTTLDALNDITAGAVWDVTLASHLTAGTTGAALNASGGAGDPWTISLPGSYGAGTAGYIIGNRVDAAISAVKAKTDNLPASPAAVGSAMTLSSGERDSVADALLDRSGAVETGVTLRGALRLVLAVLAGKVSGAGTGTEVFKNAVADTKARVTATVDSSGNRTAITHDQT